MLNINSIRSKLEILSLELKGNIKSKAPEVSYPYKQSIRFRNGFVLKTEGFSEPLINKLLNLANEHSVEFSDVRTNSQQWLLNTAESVLTLPNGLNFDFDSIDPLIFSETYIYDIHFSGFDLSNKVILDAGGFVGDTALYYANLGAEVYTFEPDPSHFAMLQRNLELNKHVSKRIHAVNAAIGSDGIFAFGKDENNIGKISETGNGDYEVESHSLDTVLSKYKIENPYLLHLDIKGSEGPILDSPAIEKFERLRVEYSPYLSDGFDVHVDYPELILNTVRSHGFGDIRLFKHNRLRIPTSIHGTLDASKR